MGVDVGVMWNDHFGAKWNYSQFLNDVTCLGKIYFFFV